MSAEDFFINHRRAGKAVETIGKRLPQLDPKATLALVIKSVDAIDRRTLVIAAEDEEIFGVFNLVREEEADCLEGLFATVDVVPQKDVVRLGGEAAIFKETEEVVVLAVDISADLDGGLELKEHGLRDEEIAGAEAEHFDFGFGEVDLFAGAGAADAEEFVDDDVDGVAEEGYAAHLAGAGGG